MNINSAGSIFYSGGDLLMKAKLKFSLPSIYEKCTGKYIA